MTLCHRSNCATAVAQFQTRPSSRVRETTGAGSGSLHAPHLAGARAFPPDDSGGPGGYEDCLEALAAEQPTEYQKERREWLGLRRPEAFDAAEWAKAFDRKKRKRMGTYEEEM